MKRFMVLAIALAIASSGFGQKTVGPSAKYASTSSDLRVAIAVDAPADMQWIITDRLTRKLKTLPRLKFVDKDPEWVIVVVAFDPFPKETSEEKRQFAMSTAFLQEMAWIDPDLLDSARNEEGGIPGGMLGEIMRNRMMIGAMYGLGSYAGLFGELGKTSDDVVDDFVKQILEPVRKTSQKQFRPVPPRLTTEPKKP